MSQHSLRNISLLSLGLLMALTVFPMRAVTAQETPAAPAPSATPQSAPAVTVPPIPVLSVAMGNRFDGLATEALKAMESKALESKVPGGAALFGFIPGDKMTTWVTRAQIVKSFTQGKNNTLAWVYAKAAEMADTLTNSGSGVRPKLGGEVGWKGGVIVQVADGYVFAAFSGGSGEQDVAIAKAGLEVLLKK